MVVPSRRGFYSANYKDPLIEITRIINYVRRSRQDEEREKRTGEDTLTTQKKIMNAVIEPLDIPWDRLEEIGSGDKIATRPVFIEVLRLLDAGEYNAIAVKEVSRLGRGDYEDAGRILNLLIAKRIYIITPNTILDPSNSTDRKSIRWELFMAREELEQTKERLNSARNTLAMEGRWMTSRPPYGYTVNSRTTRLEPAPEKSLIVQWIFDWYVNGIEQDDGTVKSLGYNAIAGRLDRMGIETPYKGKRGWSYNTVRTILQNQAYIGTVIYRATERVGTKSKPRPEGEWIICEEAHEPLVDKDVFTRTRTRIENIDFPRNKIDFSACELAGLFVCSHCGMKMLRQYSVQHYTKANGEVSIYHKEFLWCRTRGCTFIKYRDAEGDLLDALRQFKDMDVEVIRKLYEATQAPKVARSTDSAIDMLTKRLEDIERRYMTACDMLERGRYTEEVFVIREAELNREKAQILKAIDESGDLSKEKIKNEEVAVNFQKTVVDVLEMYKQLNKTRRNEMLKTIIEVVEVKKEGKRNTDFELIIKPRWGYYNP